MYTMSVPPATEGQKMESDILELVLQIVLSCQVDAGKLPCSYIFIFILDMNYVMGHVYFVEVRGFMLTLIC